MQCSFHEMGAMVRRLEHCCFRCLGVISLMKALHRLAFFVAGIATLAPKCSRAQTSYSVHAYYTSDACDQTPNRVDVGSDECESTCKRRASDWRSVQGFCDTVDYTTVVSEAFVGSAYILVEAFNDSGCTTFQDATAFQVTGSCSQVITFVEEWGFATYAIVTENAGSVSIRYFDDSKCKSPLLESVPLIGGSIATEDIDVDVSSFSCDANNLVWTYSAGTGSSSGSSTSTSSSTPTASSRGSSSSGGTTRSPSVDSGTGSESSPATTSSSGSNVGLIAGVVGGVVAVLVIIGCVLWCRGQSSGKGSTQGHYYQENDQQHISSLAAILVGGELSGQAGLWEDNVITKNRIEMHKVETQELIGRGAFGEVYKGTFDNTPVAVKMLLKETRNDMQHANAFLSEAKMTATMDHPNIICLVGVAWTYRWNLNIVMEYMDAGDLRALLNGYEEKQQPVGIDRQKATIAFHVCHALAYLHSFSPAVIHRDLKSHNILLKTIKDTTTGSSKLEAKLTDFGISREKLESTMTAGVGTLLWMAPEVILGKKYDDKADMFSFGVVLSELDWHSLPYTRQKAEYHKSNGRSLPVVLFSEQVASGKLRVDFSKPCLRSIAELGTECVSVDPNMRPTAAEALCRLRDILAKELPLG